MKQINKNNYLTFFFDYYEGNLSPLEQGEVILFLEENPDLKTTFEEYPRLLLNSSAIPFPGKELMKKKYSAEGIAAILSSDITLENCDQFFIAYTENQLFPEQILKIEAFLSANPEQEKQLYLFKQAKLHSGRTVFQEKETLKKSLVTKHNCEEYFIRWIEKDLNRVEEEQVKSFLEKYPAYKKELKLFGKTANYNPETIVFPNKELLKKKQRKPIVAPLFTRKTIYYAAAAIMLLLAGIFFVLKNKEEVQIITVMETVEEDKQEKIKLEGEASAHQKEKNKKSTQSQNSLHNVRAFIPSPKSIIVENREQEYVPVIMEDKAVFIADKEPEQAILITETAEHNEEKEIFISALADAGAYEAADRYVTPASLIRKKARQILGIKKVNECDAEEKITFWDLAMAAKSGVQNFIGTKSIDVNKVCDTSAGKVEYIFAAGNFEISKKLSK